MADTYGCSARILVNGRKVREYEREDGAIFVESKHGSEYEIELKNHKGTKVLAIVSVDGLDVISGKKATNKSPGYILKPHSSMRVKGFRKDDDTVGAFRFIRKNKSYAKGQGQGGEEGVISVRFFDEKNKQILYGNGLTITGSAPIDHVYWTSPSTGTPIEQMPGGTCIGKSDITYSHNVSEQMRCCASDSSAHYTSLAGYQGKAENMMEMKTCSNPFKTGTTWGTKKYDKVHKRDFERGNMTGEINFYYTTKDGLKQLGVPVVEEKYVSYPKGFSDYATPPKGWA
jgi:hypothetical protein